MPGQIINIQVGQCGNQVASRFWDLALQEHQQSSSGHDLYTGPTSTYFRNVCEEYEPPRDIFYEKGKNKIQTLKARSVVIDTEEGVAKQLLKGKNGKLYDKQMMLYDLSGAGNNFAQGHFQYGPQLHEQLLDIVRKSIEKCDYVTSFILTHSLGGGTGSGLGTYILKMLSEEFSEAMRFTLSVFPSNNDHVVTSPYNALLAINQLIEHSDCVFPIENEQLINICNKIDQKERILNPSNTKGSKNVTQLTGKENKPFDRMNNICANIILHLTSSARFGGSLNVDLNELSSNMIPYPNMQFLIPSMSPILMQKHYQYQNQSSKFSDQAFFELFQPNNQLIHADVKRYTYLSQFILARGKLPVSDIINNLSTLSGQLQMINWNKLSSKNVYKHHYLEFMDDAYFQYCKDNLVDIMEKYKKLNST